MTSDDDLWLQSRRDGKDAFAILFQRYFERIYRYLFRRTADPLLAEDLASFVFLEAWRCRDTALSPGRVRPWLYAIATNVLHNERRSTRRFRAALKRLDSAAVEPDFSEDAADRIDAAAAMTQILSRVRDLPKRDKDVLALVVWEGLSSSEAAFALGIPDGTVRTRLHRMRERITTAEAGRHESLSATEGADT